MSAADEGAALLNARIDPELEAAIDEWIKLPIQEEGEGQVAKYGPGVYPPENLPEGLTTVWDAAMIMTGHDPRYLADLGLFGPNQTEDNLEKIMQCTIQKYPDNTTFDFYCDLRARLYDGRLRPVRPAYRPDGKTLDPFRSVVLTAHVRAVFNAREALRPADYAQLVDFRASDARPVLPASSPARKKPGPEARVRNRLSEQMKADYKNDIQGLEREKLVTLRNRYKSPQTSTRAAKKQAVEELRKNRGLTPNSECSQRI